MEAIISSLWLHPSDEELEDLSETFEFLRETDWLTMVMLIFESAGSEETTTRGAATAVAVVVDAVKLLTVASIGGEGWLEDGAEDCCELSCDFMTN